jgi:hypothetical protein
MPKIVNSEPNMANNQGATVVKTSDNSRFKPKSGFGHFTEQQKAQESIVKLSDFFIMQNQTVEVQLLDPEPAFVYTHSMKVLSSKGRELFKSFICQKANDSEAFPEQDRCLGCEKVGAPMERAYIRVVDYRGAYKEGSFNNIPEIKLFQINKELTSQLATIATSLKTSKRKPKRADGTETPLRLNEVLLTLTKTSTSSAFMLTPDNSADALEKPLTVPTNLSNQKIAEKTLVECLPFASDEMLIKLGL